MKLTIKESDLAVVDDVLDQESFKKFWKYFNDLDFAYRSMNNWQKVWKINDGQVLSSAPYFHVDAPFNSQMDLIHQNISLLAKQHFSDIIGEWDNISISAYLYPVNTKISWHDDYGYTGAAIFYPHLNWNPNWGGELLVAKTPSPKEVVKGEDEDFMTRNYVNPLLNHYGLGTYISPLPNRMVFTSGSVWHSINRVDQSAGDHIRCSVVAFFIKDNHT